MLEMLAYCMGHVEEFLWTYLGFASIVGVGCWLTLKTRFAQIRLFPKAIKYALHAGKKEEEGHGVHPLKAFWATLGGAVGIGNVVGICSAVQIGGPGAVFWVWVVAFIGVLLKYTEVYIGMLYRQKRADGGWDGGPMYYLKHAYSHKWVPYLAAGLLWIYGVEVYQFHVMVDAFALTWDIPRTYVMVPMLLLVFLAVRGGMKSLSAMASKVVPIMIGCFLLMTSIVLVLNLGEIPHMLKEIFIGAFTGSAAVGGFVGSSFMQVFSQGIARGCYASDIGIGYTSILHTESSETRPERQASLTFLGMFADILGMCTLSMFLILVTGVWHEPIDQSLQVQVALSRYFPGMHLLMPVMIFFLGYSTVSAFFFFGLKCSSFLSPKWGPTLYYIYGFGALVFFTTYGSTSHAMLLMSLVQLALLVINIGAFLKLYSKVKYEIGDID
jgi:AGCS family alanine or glycine:cation symporter